MILRSYRQPKKMEKEDNIKSNSIEKRVDSKSLKNFRKESAYRVIANDDHFFYNAKALIKYSKGLFDIKIICDKKPNKKVFDDFDSNYKDTNLAFSKSGSIYKVASSDIRHITQTFTDPFIVQFKVNKIYKKEENKNQFYRLIIPIKSKPNFKPFQSYKLSLGGAIYYGLIKSTIEKKDYQLYHFKNDDLKEFYLVIDCLNQISEIEFEEAIRTILKTYSLFTGNLYQSEFYFFRTEKIEDWWKYSLYKFENELESIISKIQIVHPVKFNDYLKHFKKEKFATIIGLTVNEEKFSIINNNIHKNFKIERIIKLLLEANKTKSLILRCSTYSVALETLSNIICKAKNNQAKPIQNNQLAELIISKFKALIVEYDSELTKDQVRILLKKINSFNNPINADKLKLAFEIMGLELNDNDLKALKARNIFLHGSTPFKKFEENERKMSNFALFSNKMHLLLTCLLLKYLGFNGAITNHYTFGKFNRNEEVDEDFFRILKPKEGWR